MIHNKFKNAVKVENDRLLSEKCAITLQKNYKKAMLRYGTSVGDRNLKVGRKLIILQTQTTREL